MAGSDYTGQAFLLKSWSDLEAQGKEWVHNAIPKWFPFGHLVVISHYLVDIYGIEWVRVGSITYTIPEGLECSWIVPISLNDNTKLRPGKQHDLVYSFTIAEDFFGQLSYLRIDNSFLIPLEKLKFMESRNKSGNRARFDAASMQSWLHILAEHKIFKRNALWAFGNFRPWGPKGRAQTIFYQGL